MRRFFVLSLLLLLLTSMTPLVYADDHFVERQEVKNFITLMVKKHGFKKQYLTRLFRQVKIRPQVITHIKKPLEQKPWQTYQMLFVNEWRVDHGVAFWKKYATTLRKAEKIYGVPASIIVATIGVETKYGQKTGDYRVIDSLTNLAFSNSPRGPFFRSELEEFLLLTQEEHLDPLKITGSYAGAIGQPQFMPSSYRHYAVNFSNSGKIDLMHNEVDIIGSIANYYHKHGWKLNEPVAVQAMFLGNRYQYLMKNNKLSHPLPLSELISYGILPKIKITPDNLNVKVVTLESNYSKEYWLGFHNFDVIKRYNPSNLYAMAVYQLSNYISALKERLNNG